MAKEPNHCAALKSLNRTSSSFVRPHPGRRSEGMTAVKAKGTSSDEGPALLDLEMSSRYTATTRSSNCREVAANLPHVTLPGTQ
jgi:hypothetical protein